MFSHLPSVTTTPVLISDNYQPTIGSVDSVNIQLTLNNNQPIDAALEIQSISGALVLPRLTQPEIDDLNMVAGGMLFNTTTGAFNMFYGASWFNVGNVSGPGSSTAGNIATFADTSGDLINDSGVSVLNVPALSIPQKNLLTANVTVKEIANLSRIAFNEDVSIIFNNSLNAIQFINNNFGGLNEQCCLVLTGIAPPPSGSTTPSCLLELQSDTGAFVVSRMSTADINSAQFFPTDGMVLYDTDQAAFLFRENGSWANLDNSTSKQTQSYVAQLGEGYNQGGFGSGSVGAARPLRDNSFTFFDTTAISSNSKGFAGSVFDGRYLYLIPNQGGVSGQITRLDVTEQFTSASSYAIFDLTSFNSSLKGFSGAVFDGSQYIYYIPFSNGSTFGQVVRFDTTQSFFSASAYSVFDLTAINANAKGFWGGLYHDGYVYFCPFATTIGSVYSGLVVRYNTNLPFSSAGSYQTFDLAGINSNLKGFEGMACDGTAIYFVPSQNSGGTHGNIVLYDSGGSFTSAGSYLTFDATTVSANAKGFVGGIFDGRFVYFVPNGMGTGSVALRYDVTFNFTDPDAYSVFDLSTLDAGCAGFIGACFDGRNVYFVPNNNGLPFGKIVQYDISKDFSLNTSFLVFDSSSLSANSVGFYGAAYDGKYVYLIPSGISGNFLGQITRINAYNGPQLNYYVGFSPSGVVSGSYTYTSLTVDSQGLVTAASNGVAAVTSVSGTAGNITSSGGTTPVINLATAGTAGTYAYPVSVTTDAFGRVTGITAGVAPVTSVSGTSGEIASSGGTTPVLSLIATAVAAGTYSYPTLTVDAFGRITNISSNSVGTVTQVNTGTGLTGGPITSTGTISIADTGVIAGGYTYATVVVNAQGQITSAFSGTNPVTSVSGTAGQIASTGGATPVLSLVSTAVTPGSYTYGGFTVDAQGRLTAASSGTSPVTSISTGTGLTGGPITSTGTISIANTAVTPGGYTYATVVINAQGQITSASSGTNPVTSVSGTAGNVTSSGGTTPVINLATAGTAGTYANPTSVTTDTFGRVTSISAGSAPVTSVSGTASNITSSGGTTPTINLATAGTAGTYTYPKSMTTDAFGRVTSVTTGTTALAELEVTSTLAYGLLIDGAQTAQSSSVQTGLYINSALSPSAAIGAGGHVAGSYIAPTITVPNVTNPAIANIAGEYINLTITGTAGKVATNCYGIFVDNGSLATATVTNAYGGVFLDPGFGTVKMALYADSFSVGYSSATPPSNGAIISGSVGIGTNAPSANAKVTLSGALSYGLLLNGTQTAQTSNRQVGLYNNVTLAPSSSISGNVTAHSVEPTITVPSGGITTSYGGYFNVTINSAGANTITSSYGLFVGAGSLTTASVTDAYGGYFSTPSFGGTSKTALYGDNLSIGYTGVTPPSSGAIISGNVGLGTNSVGGAKLSVNTTGAFNTRNLGTQTSQSSNRQIGTYLTQTFAPAAQITGNVTGISIEPTITVPDVTNPAIAKAYGEYINLTIDGTAGKTLTNLYGLYVDNGSLSTASVTNAYGGYFSAPTMGGTVNQALYADNLSIGVTGSTPSANGMLISGSINSSSTTDSTSASTGAFFTSGGIGIAKALFCTASSTFSFASGVSGSLLVTNSNNTAGSDSNITIKVGGASAGDPTLLFNVQGGTGWMLGLDNDNATTGLVDALTLSQSSTFGTNDVFIISKNPSNIGLWGYSDGGGQKILFMANRTTAPTSNPTGGGILYAEAGALKWRGSSGTVTTVAPA